MTIRIHVLRQSISTNKDSGGHLPVVTIADQGKVSVGDHVEVFGPSRVIYDKSSDPPVYIDTDAEYRLTYRGKFVCGRPL